MNNWINFNIGDKVHYSTIDFDGKVDQDCIVLNKCNDYIQLLCDDFIIWIDELSDATLTLIKEEN